MELELRLKDLLSKFTINDDSRPNFKEPFTQNGNIYSTNGQILIRIKGINLSGYKELEEPNCDSAFIDTKLSDSLKLEQLEHLLSEVEYIDEIKEIGSDVECKECQGEGFVEWEYDRWTKYFECPVCDGEGFVERVIDIKTGNVIKNPEAVIPIVGKYLYLKYLDLLYQTMIVFDTNVITIKYNKKEFEQAIFCINDNVDVLIMPCVNC